MSEEQIDAILLAIGTTGERQVWFTRSEVKRAMHALVEAIDKAKDPEKS